ncbi:MAG: thioesterase II family protein [Bacillota bacterium]
MEKIKLFCLSYAGGSAMVYNSWKKTLDDLIELHPVEIPGRGTRYSEPLCDTMEEIVDNVLRSVIKELNGSDYAFFGHSMGTIIIYELIHRIRCLGYKEPLHTFFSGRFPPHFNEKNPLHKLQDEEFKSEIFKLGGTPKEFIDNQELFDIFMPILRADYTAIETYKYTRRAKWDFNISVLYGTQDIEVQQYDYSEWESYVNGECNFYEFAGDHFFIHSNEDQIVKIINCVLLESYIEKGSDKSICIMLE